jgi:hypothetical protein
MLSPMKEQMIARRVASDLSMHVALIDGSAAARIAADRAASKAQPSAI